MSKLPVSLCIGEMVTNIAIQVYATIQLTFGSQNFSWRAVTEKNSARCRENRFSLFWGIMVTSRVNS